MGFDLFFSTTAPSSNPPPAGEGVAPILPGNSAAPSLSLVDPITPAFSNSEEDTPYNILGKPMRRKDLEADPNGQQFLKVMDANKTGQRGFVEAITDVGVADLPALQDVLPIKDILEVRDIFQKLKDGEDVADSDRIKAAAYWADTERQSQAGVPGMVGDILRKMPGFMMEFAALTWAGTQIGAMGGGAVGAGVGAVPGAVAGAIGGAGTAIGRKIISTIGRKAAVDAASTAMKGAAENLMKTVAGDALRTYGATVAKEGADMAIRGTATALGHAIITGAGNLAQGESAFETAYSARRQIGNVLSGSDESVTQARLLGMGDMWIQYFTEASGEFLNAALPVGKVIGGISGHTELGRSGGQWLRAVTEKQFGKEAANKIISAQGIGAKIAEIATLKNIPLDRAYTFLKTAGYNGTIEEMGEERLGGFLSGLLGIEGDTSDGRLANAFDQMIPSMDQFKAEAIAFAVPAVSLAAINRGKIGLRGGITQFEELYRTAAAAARKRADGNAVELQDGEITPYRQDGSLNPDTGERSRVTVDQGIDSVEQIVEQFMTRRPEGYLGKVADAVLNVAESVLTGSLSMHPGMRGGLDQILATQGVSPLAGVYTLVRENALKEQGVEDIDKATPEQLRKAKQAAREALAGVISADRGVTTVKRSEVESALSAAGKELGDGTSLYDDAARALRADGRVVTTDSVVKWLNEKTRGEDAPLMQIDLGMGRQVWMRKASFMVDQENSPEAVATRKLLSNFIGVEGGVDMDKMASVEVAAQALSALAHETTPTQLRQIALNPFTSDGFKVARVMGVNMGNAESVKKMKKTLEFHARLAERAASTGWVHGETMAQVGVIPQANGLVTLVPGSTQARDILSSKSVETTGASATVEQQMLNAGFTRLFPKKVKLMSGSFYYGSSALKLSEPFRNGYDWSPSGRTVEEREKSAVKFIIETLGGRKDPHTGKYYVSVGAMNTLDTLHLPLLSSTYHGVEDVLEQGEKIASLSRPKETPEQKTLRKQGTTDARVAYMNAVRAKFRGREEDAAVKKLAKLFDPDSAGTEAMSKLATLYFFGYDKSNVGIPYKKEIVDHLDELVGIPEFNAAMHEYLAGSGLAIFEKNVGKLNVAQMEDFINPELDREDRAMVDSRLRGLAVSVERKKPEAKKPAAEKPVEAKPVEAKPAEAKPAEAKPAEAKPAEAKPVATPAPVPVMTPAPVRPASSAVTKKAAADRILARMLGGKGIKRAEGLTAEDVDVPQDVDHSISLMTDRPELLVALATHALRRSKVAIPDDPQEYLKLALSDDTLGVVARRVGATLADLQNIRALLAKRTTGEQFSGELVDLLKEAGVTPEAVGTYVQPATVDEGSSDSSEGDAEGVTEEVKQRNFDESAAEFAEKEPLARLVRWMMGPDVGFDRALSTLNDVVAKFNLAPDVTPANYVFRNEDSFYVWTAEPSESPELGLVKEVMASVGYENAKKMLRISKKLHTKMLATLTISGVMGADGTLTKESISVLDHFYNGWHRQVNKMISSATEKLRGMPEAQRPQIFTDMAKILSVKSGVTGPVKGVVSAVTDIAQRRKLLKEAVDALVYLTGDAKQLDWLSGMADERLKDKQTWGMVANLYARLDFSFVPQNLRSVKYSSWRSDSRRRISNVLRGSRDRETGEFLESPVAMLLIDTFKDQAVAPARVKAPNGGTLASVEYDNLLNDAHQVLKVETPEVTLSHVTGVTTEARRFDPLTQEEMSSDSTAVNGDEMNSDMREKVMRLAHTAMIAGKRINPGAATPQALFIPILGDKPQTYAYAFPASFFGADYAKLSFEQAYEKMADAFYRAVEFTGAGITADAATKRIRLVTSGASRYLAGLEGGLGDTFKVFVADNEHGDGSARFVPGTRDKVRVSITDQDASGSKAHYLGLDANGKFTIGKTNWNLEPGNEAEEKYMAAAEQAGFDAVTDRGGFKVFDKAERATLDVGGEKVEGWAVTLRTSNMNQTTNLGHANTAEARRVAHPALYDLFGMGWEDNVLDVIRDVTSTIADTEAAKIPGTVAEKIDPERDRFVSRLLEAGVSEGFPLVYAAATRTKIAAVRKLLLNQGYGIYAQVLPSYDPLSMAKYRKAVEAGENTADIEAAADAGLRDYGVDEEGNLREATIRVNLVSPGHRFALFLKTGRSVDFPYVEELGEGLDAKYVVRTRSEVASASTLKQLLQGYEKARRLEEASKNTGIPSEFFRTAILSMLEDEKKQAPDARVNLQDLFDADGTLLSGRIVDGTGEYAGRQFLMGAPGFMHRTPGSHTHAHVMVSIFGPVTWEKNDKGRWVPGKGNFAKAHPEVIRRGGIDFDGDMANVHTLKFDRKTGELPVRPKDDVKALKEWAGNQILLRQMEGYRRTDRELLKTSIEKGIIDAVVVQENGRSIELGKLVSENKGSSKASGISKLHDFQSAKRATEIAAASTNCRGIAVAEFRRFQYLFRQGLAGFGSLQVPGVGTIHRATGTVNVESDRVAHDLFQNVVNIIIDDIGEPRSAYLRWNEVTLPLFTTMLMGTTFKSKADIIPFVQRWVDFANTPEVKAYEASIRRKPFMQRESRFAELAKPELDQGVMDAIRGLVTINNNVASAASWATMLYGRPEDINDLVRFSNVENNLARETLEPLIGTATYVRESRGHAIGSAVYNAFRQVVQEPSDPALKNYRELMELWERAGAAPTALNKFPKKQNWPSRRQQKKLLSTLRYAALYESALSQIPRATLEVFYKQYASTRTAGDRKPKVSDALRDLGVMVLTAVNAMYEADSSVIPDNAVLDNLRVVQRGEHGIPRIVTTARLAELEPADLDKLADAWDSLGSLPLEFSIQPSRKVREQAVIDEKQPVMRIPPQLLAPVLFLSMLSTEKVDGMTGMSGPAGVVSPAYYKQLDGGIATYLNRQGSVEQMFARMFWDARRAADNPGRGKALYTHMLRNVYEPEAAPSLQNPKAVKPPAPNLEELSARRKLAAAAPAAPANTASFSIGTEERGELNWRNIVSQNAVRVVGKKSEDLKRYNEHWAPIIEQVRVASSKAEVRELERKYGIAGILLSKVEMLTSDRPEYPTGPRAREFMPSGVAEASQLAQRDTEARNISQVEEGRGASLEKVGPAVTETPGVVATRALDLLAREYAKRTGNLNAVQIRWNPLYKNLARVSDMEGVREALMTAVASNNMDPVTASSLLRRLDGRLPYQDKAAFRNLSMYDSSYVESQYKHPDLITARRETPVGQAVADFQINNLFGDGSGASMSVEFYSDALARMLHPFLLRGAPAVGRELLNQAGWANRVTGRMSREYETIMKAWGLYGSTGRIMKIKETRDADVVDMVTGKPTGAKKRTYRYSIAQSDGKLTDEDRQLLLLAHTAADMAQEHLTGMNEREGMPDYLRAVEAMMSRVRIDLPISSSSDAMLRKVLPKAIAEKAIALRNEIMAREKAATTEGLSQKVALALRDAGIVDFKVRRTMGPDGRVDEMSWEPESPIWTIPSRWVEAELQSSEAKKKLVAAGRNASDISVRALAKSAAGLYAEVLDSVNKHVPSMIGGDALYLRHRQGYTTHRWGIGFLGNHEATVQEMVERDLRKVTAEREKTYRDVLSVAVDKAGIPRPVEKSSEKMLQFMFNMKGILFQGKTAALATIKSGLHKDMGLHPEMTMADVVNEIHKDTMQLLQKRALEHAERTAAGGVPGTEITDPQALAKAAGRLMSNFKNREFSARTRARSFNNYDEAYARAGLIHDSVGVMDKVKRYTDDVVMQARKEILLNQIVLMQTPAGVPLVIPDPVNDFEGENVIKPATWALMSQRLAEYTGHQLDPKKTTKENIHDMLDKYIVKAGTHVVVDSSHASVARYYAFTTGPKQENVMDMMLAGGETPGMLKHILDEAWNDPWGVLDTLDHVNLWMKTIALQGSLFFPLAGVESLVAATGGKGVLQMGEWVTFRNMMRSNDPYISELMSLSEEANIEFARSSDNPMGLPTGLIQKDVARMATEARLLLGPTAEKAVKSLGGLVGEQSKFVFEDVFNTMKLWFVHRVMVEEREAAAKKGMAFDPKATLAVWADAINDSLGGQEPARYSWLTPSVRRMLGLSMFSWNWCVDDKTRAMTKTGLKYHNEIAPGDEILIFDPATRTTRWSRVNDKFTNPDYKGPMVRIRNYNKSVLMTPDHKCYLVNDKTGDAEIRLARDIKEHWNIPRSAPFSGLPETETVSDRLVQIAGWLVTDGHYAYAGNKGHTRFGVISQSKPENVKKIKTLGLAGKQAKFRNTNFKANYAATNFYVPVRTVDVIEELGVENKLVTWKFIQRLSARQVRLLYDTMLLGNGTGKRRFCGRKESIDSMVLIQTVLGMPTTFWQQQDNCWLSREVSARTINTRGKVRSTEEFSGTIWCPSVDTGFWVAEREGMLFITGNTLSAWNIGGGSAITGQLIKNYSSPLQDKFVFLKNWPAMIAIVMVGVPAILQAVVYAAAGNDDDDAKNLVDRAKLDTPWLWKNEPGRKLYADITPMLRKLPWHKGDPTGDRRQYIHWGKQSWEIIGWLDDPWKNMTGKMSQLARAVVEQATGETVGMGWDLGFKGMGLAGLVMDKEGGFSGSRLGMIGQKFSPFSILAWAQNTDAAPLQMIAPISKGISFNKATEAYISLLETWARKDTYTEIYANRTVQANLQALGGDILDAAEKNGYDPKKVVDAARAAILKTYYSRIYKAIEDNDLATVEEASKSVMRINGTAIGVTRSMVARNKLHGKAPVLTEEQKKMLKEAFTTP